jgi:hypothetical protein
MTPPTLQQPRAFQVIYNQTYKRPWIVRHIESKQYVRFCKTAESAEKIAHELNSALLAHPMTDEQA